ncbi:type VII secretion integral membrane protein EccD [Kitasatospora sp. GAS204A]|nr:type VII secretion integral membrane protein EccD [Kitasatospora sp. GAS204B]
MSMSGSAIAGLCRLRFRAPETTFELAVPADVQLADLLPTVLGYAGADLEEKGLEHGGWVLQKLGGEPLDENRTLDALELHDGDELHLRPRRQAFPPVHFDDLVDGVRTGMQERGDNWRPALTHHFALGLGLVALAGGLALLAMPGPQQLREIAATVVGMLLLLGAVSAARAVGDAIAGTALGAMAIPYLATAGLLLPVGTAGPALTGARLLAGSSAAAGAAVLGLAAVGCSAPFFLGAVVLALLGVISGVLALCGLSAHDSALAVAVVVVVFGALMPSVAFRLSGLRLPALPRNAEELQEEIEPFEASGVLSRSVIADNYLLAFHLVAGLALTASLSLLGTGTSTAARCFTVALSVLLLLHARAIGSIWQRLTVLLPGAYGLALLLAGIALHQSPTGRLGVLAGLVSIASVLLVAAWSVPGKRLLPYWGRAADLLHTLSAVSLVPLGMWAIGVFGKVRGLGG